ncbi:MAG: hypothetical protein IJ087_21245 [Eggerthellaceae bacterium]|nr:hypothetical protein [Eggerthellaceae bacterium]
MKSQIVVQKQDLTGLSWAKARQSSGTAGSFLKSSDELGPRKTYYKLSDYDSVRGIVGHECVNEIVVDRLLEILGVEHLHYQLIHADVRVDGRVYETWLNASEDFKAPGENKLALDDFYQLERTEGERPLDFCERLGWQDQAFQSIAVAFRILIRDRHGANLEVLRNPRSRTMRLAPLFDHGLSLMFRARTDDNVASFDAMADLPVQSFLGSHSARDNLGLIPPERLPRFNALREGDRAALFEGLGEATTPAWRDKAWEMIWGRWCAYEAFRVERQR